MTDPDLSAWRGQVRRGNTPAELIAHLRAIVLRMVRRRVLPPAFAPYGQWDDEAAEEIFAAWFADRLVGEGQLIALLDRSSSAAGLRGLAERSVRQHLLNTADRSQTRNLFGRIVDLLRGDPDRFVTVGAAARAAETWFALRRPGDGADGAPTWSGSDAQLAACAWSLGDLVVVRYRADAAKLSPVLDTTELDRFITGMFVASESALTPRLILSALGSRIELDEPSHEDLEKAPAQATNAPPPDVQVVRDDTARAILAQLTVRQREVLRRGDDPVAAIGRDLQCSVGTVVNERRRIGDVVTRLSADNDERDALLNIAADRLYLQDDDA
ncbi:MAG: hypothetical protein JWQ76_5786 [Ramlibacter sp.]|jgi:hypothetical protein|nr:hypothetical protein [Ramlibacter sp.]